MNPPDKLKILVACEFSGRVRRAFRDYGHDAWSCDIDKSNDDSPYHLQCDVREVLSEKWDMMIGFPPCTYLTLAGNRWYNKHTPERAKALEFVKMLWDADIPLVALENPPGALSSSWRKPSQVIHPWQFGHPEPKRTCLWLRNLPRLVPTCIVTPGESEIVKYSGEYENRQKVRSLTYLGIAQAMADQWQPSEIRKHQDLVLQSQLQPQRRIYLSSRKAISTEAPQDLQNSQLGESNEERQLGGGS